MQLGLDSYSYHYAAGLWEYAPRENAPMGAQHFVRKAAELGLDGVRLCDPRLLDSLEYGYVVGLRERAEALGLYVELGTTGTNPDHLQNLVRAAHVLGSAAVGTTVGKPRPRSAEAMDLLLEETAGELEQVVPVCERYGVGLVIENHQELTGGELGRLAEMVGSPWLGAGFDTGDPLALLEDPVEAARALGGAIRSVHLKDYQVAATSDGFALVGCALGEGVVDLDQVLGLVSSQAAEVGLTIETPVEKRVLPVLDESYLGHLPTATASDLGRTLRLVRDRGLRQMPRLPLERGASEEEILASEDEMVVRSVRWAQRALGRAEAEVGEPESGGG